jgi:hypothetical protein
MAMKRTFVLIVFLILVSLACQVLSVDSSVDEQNTDLAVRATLDALATADAQTAMPEGQVSNEPDATRQAQSTPEAQANATAAEQSASAATATQAQALKETTTSGIVAQATEQAAGMSAKVEKLYSEGLLESKNGRFVALDDFDQSWAQINWYQWTDTGYSPRKYAVQAHTWWSSASDKANWNTSGCGFVFGEQDKENHHVIFLGLDGYVYLARVLGGKMTVLAQKRYGKLDIPEGQADVMLVVNGSQISYFVNDTQVLSIADPTLKEGSLNLTLLSGTNSGYGTRCIMTEIGLWIIE